ncbi:hypothetical protein ACFV1W_26520 [Kitasatospora sp. NPDC059648]|uniref:hypothetical protein n=1 Tax=Kitasatospora sp. NPDC059648 TaxID=3346894 RepID=UPI00369ED30B
MSETLASAQASAAVDAPIQPPAASAAPAPAPGASKRRAEPQLEHTRGGLPAVPLAVTTANSVVGLASAAALTSGPVVALAATAGTVATSAIATRVARRAAAKAAQRATATTPSGGGQRAPHLSLVKSPTSQRGSAPSSGLGRSRTAAGPTSRAGAGPVGVPRQSPGGAGGSSTRSGPSSLRSPGSTAGRTGAGPVPSGPRGSDTGRSGGVGSVLKKSPGAGKSVLGRVAARAGEVKAVRAADRQAAPTRSERRTQQNAARRQVTDARRAAKAAERDRNAAQRGPVGRTLAKPATAIRRSLDKARGKARTAADQSTERKVTDARREARKAPARREARNRLRRSATRFHGRRVLAALLALPVGLIGMVTTPIGRALGWSWLMYPGRRLYRRLAGKAAQQRAERDAAIRQELADAEQAVDEAIDNDDPTGEQAVTDTVPRAPKHHQPAHTSPTALGGDMAKSSGFDFSEVASEMYGSAMNYNPEGMMHVLAAFEAMPEGLESIANTFRVLAERSDEEFPLDKVVGEALNEVYTLLMTAVSASEEVGKAFRGAHEEDISRHENPRNGEEKWDIVNNQ